MRRRFRRASTCDGDGWPFRVSREPALSAFRSIPWLSGLADLPDFGLSVSESSVCGSSQTWLLFTASAEEGAGSGSSAGFSSEASTGPEDLVTSALGRSSRASLGRRGVLKLAAIVSRQARLPKASRYSRSAPARDWTRFWVR